uniref:Membrane transporter protein n=1 Tax=Spongospora subterranea TaxID=70186 RepID=A0A0H5QY82_9EUKA|eukprot:CRZ00544.1 hypothetical protein [Spongospora subterranea]
MICVIWLVVVAFSVLRSGKSGEPSIIGVRSYSLTYWVLTIGGIFTLSILTWILSSNLNKRIQAKLATGWIPNSSEVIWTNPNSGVYPIFAALAGLIGGLLGIGGGMVLAPLLIELGFHDLVVSATSATAVLLTSSSALTQYIILDMLLPSYSIVYLSVGIAATASGQITFSYLVAKYNRTSFLVGSIAIMIIVSTILLGISGIINTIEDYKTGNMGITKPW